MEHDIIRSLDPRMLGRRLQEARKARGLTQQEAADHLDVARTTVTAIEKGERRIQPMELVRLATLYGRSIGELLRRGEPLEAFTVQLRAASAAREGIENEVGPRIGEFRRLCEDYFELERLTGAPLARRYPIQYEIGRVSPENAAEDIAISERNRLGLGDGPVLNLREVLENDVGLRIFHIEMPSGISEMFNYTEQLGGCIATNRKHPEERRRMSVGHGYGHFLTNRFQSEICGEQYQRVPLHERFAAAFASAFLMPAAGIRRRFHELEQRREAGATPADLLTLGHLYFVSPEALTRRLEDLRLVREGTWDSLTIRGFRVREAQQILGLSPRQSSDDMLPARYQYLAVEAFARAEISEGQLARFLRTDRLEARRLVAELTSATPLDEEYPLQARFDLGESLPTGDD